MFKRKALGFVLLLAASAAAGCGPTIVVPRPEDRAAHDGCVQEGLDPGTTEFANCMEELSQTDPQ